MWMVLWQDCAGASTLVMTLMMIRNGGILWNRTLVSACTVPKSAYRQQVQRKQPVPTGGTINNNNNKTDIAVRDNDKGKCVNGCCKSWRLTCDKEISREHSKIRMMYYRNTAHVECNNKSDIINIRVKLYHLIMIRKKPEQHIGYARQEGTTENSNIRHWTVLWEVRLSQDRTLNMRNNITCGTKCNYRTAATLCTVGTWFGSVVSL